MRMAYTLRRNLAAGVLSGCKAMGGEATGGLAAGGLAGGGFAVGTALPAGLDEPGKSVGRAGGIGRTGGLEEGTLIIRSVVACRPVRAG